MISEGEQSNEIPWRRGPGCDICGRDTPLRRVVLKPGSKDSAGNFKGESVAYICADSRHVDGEPVRAPSTTMAEGTSRLQPQRETLL